jgi:hypothetical protein
MIVAWHEVPGTAPPQKEPSRRVRYDSCRCAHRFEDLREEISSAVSLSRINWQRAMAYSALVFSQALSITLSGSYAPPFQSF